MRVEEAFAAAGVNVHGQPIPERRFRATCPECSHAAALDTMETTESGEQTNYACEKCGATVITVSPSPGLGGYRLGAWVVFPVGPMEIDVPGPGESL
jgi:hypothetical protein